MPVRARSSDRHLNFLALFYPRELRNGLVTPVRKPSQRLSRSAFAWRPSSADGGLQPDRESRALQNHL